MAAGGPGEYGVAQLDSGRRQSWCLGWSGGLRLSRPCMGLLATPDLSQGTWPGRHSVAGESTFGEV